MFISAPEPPSPKTESLCLPDNGFDERGILYPRDLVVLEPPLPIRDFVYRCDRQFHIESIEGLYAEQDAYSLILIQGQEAQLWDVSVIGETRRHTIRRSLQKQHSMGGQSQNRISRLRDESIAEYLKSVASKARNLWLREGQCTTAGLILAGHGEKPQQLTKYLDRPLSDSILTRIVCDERATIESLRPRIAPILDKTLLETQRSAIRRWADLLVQDPDLLTFGPDECASALEMGMLREIMGDAATITPLKEMASNVGCAITELKAIDPESIMMLQDYDGICGIRWYSNK